MLLAMSARGGEGQPLQSWTDEFCLVNDSIGWINRALGVSPVLEYTGVIAAGSAIIRSSTSILPTSVRSLDSQAVDSRRPWCGR